MTGTEPMEKRPEVPAARLLVTLAGAGALAGLLIVFVFGWTEPTISAYKARMLQLAVQEVLEAPDRYDTLYVYDGTLADSLPEGVKPSDVDVLYRGYREDGTSIGYAIAAGEPGFQDIVRLIFGYDPRTQTILGMKVLESKETPGLGDKIEKDMDFVTQFQGAISPLLGVKPRNATGTDPHEVAMITGATISSRAVIRIINNALERLEPAFQEAVAEGTR